MTLNYDLKIAVTFVEWEGWSPGADLPQVALSLGCGFVIITI